MLSKREGILTMRARVYLGETCSSKIKLYCKGHLYKWGISCVHLPHRKTTPYFTTKNEIAFDNNCMQHDALNLLEMLDVWLYDCILTNNIEQQLGIWASSGSLKNWAKTKKICLSGAEQIYGIF